MKTNKNIDEFISSLENGKIAVLTNDTVEKGADEALQIATKLYISGKNVIFLVGSDKTIAIGRKVEEMLNSEVELENNLYVESFIDDGALNMDKLEFALTHNIDAVIIDNGSVSAADVEQLVKQHRVVCVLTKTNSNRNWFKKLITFFKKSS
jgi:hypothetical protein